MPSAYLLVAHGSRDPRRQMAMEQLAKLIYQQQLLEARISKKHFSKSADNLLTIVEPLVDIAIRSIPDCFAYVIASFIKGCKVGSPPENLIFFNGLFSHQKSISSKISRNDNCLIFLNLVILGGIVLF